MSATAVAFVLFMVCTAAYLVDHYGRWLEHERSKLTPEQRAALPHKIYVNPLAAIFGELGKNPGLLAPIGAFLNMLGSVSEFVYKPIGMIFGFAAFAKKN